VSFVSEFERELWRAKRDGMKAGVRFMTDAVKTFCGKRGLTFEDFLEAALNPPFVACDRVALEAIGTMIQREGRERTEALVSAWLREHDDAV